MLALGTFLSDAAIAPAETLVFRHRPWEVALNRVLPWLAEEKPELFNLYQRTHAPRTESAMKRTRYVASFIANKPGQALFIGLYNMTGYETVTYRWCAEQAGFKALVELGMSPFDPATPDNTCLLFDLEPVEPLSALKGRLQVEWTSERSYFQWAGRGEGRFAVTAVHEEAKLIPAMPDWDRLVLDWTALQALPAAWRDRISQWRGIYLITDTQDGLAYVGSAGGADNILGRWMNYAATGHGGNQLLKARDPQHFQFSILQRLSPDLSRDDVVAVEQSWKERLRTRAPHGLNAN